MLHEDGLLPNSCSVRRDASQSMLPPLLLQLLPFSLKLDVWDNSQLPSLQQGRKKEIKHSVISRLCDSLFHHLVQLSLHRISMQHEVWKPVMAAKSRGASSKQWWSCGKSLNACSRPHGDCCALFTLCGNDALSKSSLILLFH